MSFKEFSTAQTAAGSGKSDDQPKTAAPKDGRAPATDKPAVVTPPAKP